MYVVNVNVSVKLDRYQLEWREEVGLIPGEYRPSFWRMLIPVMSAIRNQQLNCHFRFF